MKKSSGYNRQFFSRIQKKLSSLPHELWQLLTIGAIIKAALFCIALLGYQLGYFCDDCRLTNGLWHPDMPRMFVSSFFTWDSQQYLLLADYWYEPLAQRNAFYPLFPFLIAIAHTILWPISFFIYGEHGLAVSAIILATLFSFGVIAIFFYTIQKLFTSRIAFWSTLLLLTFPTGYTLHVVYTESLFLILLCGLVLALRDDRYRWMSFFAFLLPLIRPQGFVAVIGILIAMLWIRYDGIPKKQAERINVIKTSTWTLLWMFGGIFLYMFNSAIFTHDLLSGVAAQHSFGSQFGFYYLFHPKQWVADALFPEHSSMFSFQHSNVSQLLFWYSIIGLYFVLRIKKTRPFIFFVGTLIAMSAIPGTLTSYARYALVLFPMYPAFAVWVEKKIPSRRFQNTLLALWCSIGLFAQLALFFYHSSNNWIA